MTNTNFTAYILIVLEDNRIYYITEDGEYICKQENNCNWNYYVANKYSVENLKSICTKLAKTEKNIKQVNLITHSATSQCFSFVA